ncbi:hypothetical protein [Streptomyces sp. L7]|uniref:hypothetical protein n=1 Tax=Streptomyces sp. L7 TaxID=3423954 RepID=UPI003D956EF0
MTNTFAYPVELSGVVSREGVLTVGAHPLQVGFDIVRSTDAGGARPARAPSAPTPSRRTRTPGCSST